MLNAKNYYSGTALAGYGGPHSPRYNGLEQHQEGKNHESIKTYYSILLP